MKAFAYIRVSGKAQLDGDGPERQREKITAFAEKHGLMPQRPVGPDVAWGPLPQLPEYFEQGVSGTIDGMDRPALVEAMNYIDRNPDEYCMIVERMDRLARTLVVQEVLLAECKKRGIKVFSADRGELVDQASDGADPSVVLIRQILGAVAQWEKSVIVMKLKAAKDRKRRETGHCEGPKPYGSTEYERSILDYAKQLKEMGHPFAHIAGSLNLSGFKTRTGKQWNKARVAHIFQNRKNV